MATFVNSDKSKQAADPNPAPPRPESPQPAPDPAPPSHEESKDDAEPNVVSAPRAGVFVTCGVMGGCRGSGGLYHVDAAAPSDRTAYAQLGELGEWTNSTVSCSDGNNLFIVTGKMDGCNGGGGLYRVDTLSGAFTRVGSADWSNATVMSSDGKQLFLVCGKKGECRGSGGLYAVDPATGTHAQLGGPGYEW